MKLAWVAGLLLASLACGQTTTHYEIVDRGRYHDGELGDTVSINLFLPHPKQWEAMTAEEKRGYIEEAGVIAGRLNMDQEKQGNGSVLIKLFDKREEAARAYLLPIADEERDKWPGFRGPIRYQNFPHAAPTAQ